MAVNRSAYSTRYVSLVLLAALGGLAMWLFVPWGQGGGSRFVRRRLPGGCFAAPVAQS